MRIEVDHDRCTGLGICESLSPDVFEVNDGGDLQLLADTVPDGQLDDVREAVAGCPTEALRIVDE